MFVPRGSTVILLFFDSFSSCPILFFKYVLKIILSIISATILLIQTRWVRVRAEAQGTNFDPSARKHQNCDMCAFHVVKWIPRRARRCCPSAPWFLAVFFPFVAIAEFKNRHSRSSGVWVVNRSGWGCPATCWHAQAHSLQVKNSCKNSGVNSLLFHFPEDRAFEVKPWEESSFLWRIGRFFYDQPQMFLEPSGISDSGAFSQSTFSDLQSEEDKGNYQFVVVVASLNYTYSCISPWRSCMTLWW